jgi:hypothetical protein
MSSRAVTGFLPSRNGFHFANRWPSAPAFWWGTGLIRLGIGDASRGLCGGMAFAVRDRFEAGLVPPPDSEAPPAGSQLFAELARRQLDSFDHLVVVPLRFWGAALQGDHGRHRSTVRRAWPAIRRDIDADRLAMVGLVRSSGVNPLQIGLGHQVAGYRYEESAAGVTIGIYDPNHPDRDDVELRMVRGHDGAIQLGQSTGEPLLGLLALPFSPRRPAPPTTGAPRA